MCGWEERDNVVSAFASVSVSSLKEKTKEKTVNNQMDYLLALLYIPPDISDWLAHITSPGFFLSWQPCAGYLTTAFVPS